MSLLERIKANPLPLAIEPGHTLQMMVLPRTDPATKQPYPLDFNQIASFVPEFRDFPVAAPSVVPPGF